MNRCQHADTNISALPTYYAEENVTVLTIRVECSECGIRFKFHGLDYEASPDAPFKSRDGFIVALPISADNGIVLSS